MEKFITDERTGLRYELVGDYYLIAGEDEPEQEQEPIGTWGQRHLRYLKEHHRVRYANLLTSGEYVMALADAFRQRVRNTDGIQMGYIFPKQNHSQIIPIRLAPQIDVADADFRAAKVFAHTAPPDAEGWREMRIGLHYYNNKEDIDRFFSVIDKKRTNKQRKEE